MMMSANVDRRPFCSCCLFAVVVLVAATAVSAREGDSTALTIYSSATPGAVSPELYRPIPGGRNVTPNYAQMIPGYAIIKQERDLMLDGERSTIRFTDVAAYIEPTTVGFTSLTDPTGTQVIEQSYEFDLVSTEKLLQKFLGKPITVVQARGDGVETQSGRLLSADGGIVLQNADGGVQIIRSYTDVRLPELPGGLIIKPTLVWDVLAKKPGKQRVRVTYETKAMTWWADYNVVFSEGKNANSGLLDIGAWVTIINKSGATYPDARLKLIAGDVHRAPQPQPQYKARRRMETFAMADAAGVAGFQEKTFFEFHLYTLGRPTTLPDNATRQIELFPTARQVPCEKVMVYYGLPGAYRGFFSTPRTDRNFGVQSNKKVDIYLRFKNEKDIGMGMPLPSGRIRVSKRDEADGTLEFIGEDTIDHTPKKEEVLIKLGSAFDVVGERKQVDFSVDNRRDTMTETIEIKLRNHKDEAVKVIVKENLYRWTNWKITESTKRQNKIDSRTIHFPVEVPADGEVTIKYTVRYTW